MTGDHKIDALLRDLQDELAIEPSPEFAMRVRERIERDHVVTDLLTDLAPELALEPSPAFAARVRGQIEQDRERRSFWSLWTWKPLAAAAAIVVVACLAWWATRRAPVSVAEQVAIVATPAAVVTPAPNASLSTPSVEARRATPRVPAPAVVVANTARGANREPAAVPASTLDMRVMIVPSEAKLMKALIASLGDGRTVVPPGDVLFDETTGAIVTPVPKEIPPIVVDPLPGSGDGRSGGSKDR